MSSEKSRIDWKRGDTAVVKTGWLKAGTKFKVLGPAIFLEQWWVPVEDPDEEDPTFFKERGLDRGVDIEPDVYIPSSLRIDTKAHFPPREVMYGIGENKEKEEYGMWEGPNPLLSDMLEVVGKSNVSTIIRFNLDGSFTELYRWKEGCWVKIKEVNHEQQT